MSRYLRLSFFSFIGLLMVSTLALAQYPIQSLLGTYNMDKSMTKTGVITDLTWANTHCVLFFDVKGDNGQVKNWAIELTNPRTLIAMGVTPAGLPEGKEVTVTFFPAVDGSSKGMVQLIKSGDKVLFDAFKSLSDVSAPPPAARTKKK